jgi:hypothetical protein
MGWICSFVEPSPSIVVTSVPCRLTSRRPQEVRLTLSTLPPLHLKINIFNSLYEIISYFSGRKNVHKTMLNWPGPYLDTRTVQAPQNPSPQASLAPVRPTDRKYCTVINMAPYSNMWKLQSLIFKFGAKKYE